jgi:hypothetical protein
VLELEDLEDGPVDLDVVAVLELVGRDDGESPLCKRRRDGLSACSLRIQTLREDRADVAHRPAEPFGTIMAMGNLTLTTTLQRRGPAAAVVLTAEQVADLGEGKKAFPAQVTINQYTWAGRVSRMGGEFLLGLSREVRTGAGVEAGDEVTVMIALDEAPREVEVPPTLAQALDADSAAKARFEALAYSHRKEFARWIAEAKKDDTRERRVAQAVQMLHEGRTRS